MVSDQGNISVYLIDTIGEYANCLCNFQVLTGISGFENGEYVVKYYHVDKESDTSLIYTFTWFNTNEPLQMFPVVTPTIGDCNEIIYSGIQSGLLYQLHIFPNPASEFVHISWPQSLKPSNISVITVTGKTLFTAMPGDQTLYLRISDFSSGVYQVILSGNQTSLSAKLVVF